MVWLKRLLFLLLLPISVLAAPLNDEQAASIYALVYGVTHLPLPLSPPEIHLTTNAKLQEMACNKPCPSIKGFQRENKIYLDQDLDMADVHNAAILFHEMVHYYQWAKSGPAKSCREWVDREIYAYHMQNLVLHKAGAQLVQAPIMPTCPEPEVRVPEKPVAGYGYYTMRYL
jgi:hypothetical protein